MRGDWSTEPFALQLLEQHRSGRTAEHLSREMGIPPERVEMRLRAATAYLQRLSASGGTGTRDGDLQRLLRLCQKRFRQLLLNVCS